MTTSSPIDGIFCAICKEPDSICSKFLDCRVEGFRLRSFSERCGTKLSDAIQLLHLHTATLASTQYAVSTLPFNLLREASASPGTIVAWLCIQPATECA